MIVVSTIDISGGISVLFLFVFGLIFFVIFGPIFVMFDFYPDPSSYFTAGLAASLAVAFVFYLWSGVIVGLVLGLEAGFMAGLGSYFVSRLIRRLRPAQNSV
jgi:hypothetical protein